MKNFFQISMSAMLALGWCSEIRGQDAAAAPAKERADGIVRREINNVGVLVEWVEVDARTANKLTRKHLSQAGPAALPNAMRDKVEKLIDTGEATLMDTNYVITRPGQRAKVESVDEVIYPTEYDPPQLAQTLALAGAEAGSTPAMPTAFETRNVGSTVEVEPNTDASRTVIDLVIAPEWVIYEGKEFVTPEGSSNEDVADMWSPKFTKMMVATAFEVRDGESKLISVARPKAEGKRILVFVQANILR